MIPDRMLWIFYRIYIFMMNWYTSEHRKLILFGCFRNTVLAKLSIIKKNSHCNITITSLRKHDLLLVTRCTTYDLYHNHVLKVKYIVNKFEEKVIWHLWLTYLIKTKQISFHELIKSIFLNLLAIDCYYLQRYVRVSTVLSIKKYK